MEQLLQQLRGRFSGEITTAATRLSAVKHDGSLFEVLPDAVVRPETVADVMSLVKLVGQHKAMYPGVSITPRGAGTDMSGAAIGSSIILDTSSLKEVSGFKGRYITAQPGAALYDIHRILAAHSLTLGSSPSSRDLSTFGGMIANNAAGEASYKHGATDRWVRSLKVVLADGNEYTIRPLNSAELSKKIMEDTYEGRLYAHLYSLLRKNYDVIRNARPHTNRTAAGYNLWDVWDKETGVFDLTKLFLGSQGTLGIITGGTIEAVKKHPLAASVALSLSSLASLPDVLKILKQYAPLSIEGFDDISFIQALQSHALLRKQLGKREYIKQQTRLSSSVLKPHRTEIMLLAAFEADTKAELTETLRAVTQVCTSMNIPVDIITDESNPLPVRRTRSSTAALIQNQIKTRHAVSFLDDMAVHPQYTVQFLNDIRKILKKNKLPATIHGHFGDGVFHIIPLVDVYSKKNAAKREPIMRQLVACILKYNGSLSGEHGDGMVRGPWMTAQFGQEVNGLFREVKELFDPLYIFNPHKKTDASWEYSVNHLRSSK